MYKFCRQATVRGDRSAFAVLLSILALAACGERTDANKPATQVAAKVNSGEISIHQINFLLQRTPNVPPDKTEETKRRILDGLVDQELAVQAALAAGLDREPRVMQTLEAARREVLAHAYLEQSAAGRAPPSAEEVRAYYREHPELFANRRLYRVQELGFAATPPALATVREQLAKARNGEELLAALRERGIKVAGGIMMKPAENIALDILPGLARMKEGQSALFENGERASLITLLGSTPEPLSEEAARPVIEQFLNRRQAGELARQAMQHLRDRARIEYVGEFGQAAEAARQAQAADAARREEESRAARETARLAQAAEADKQAAAMKEAARESAAAQRARTESRPRLPAPSDSALHKGLSGLR